ncbi:dihydroxy-acid dehydratase, partial [Chitinophaga sp.]|uniref:dihydroxy-acid dehydratase domain-containing protein n=1 Tax=uncultured Chitinophaga sp. TaxID=339340 RepID=UPI00260E12A3
KTAGENISKAKSWDPLVIAPADAPVNARSGIVVLKGNLCENGSIIKPSAASPHLMQHTGKAVVFSDIEDYKRRINDPGLEVDADSVLVLKNAGPKGYPGMPEVGNLGLPAKLLQQGVTDMVRISDGRMSGTGFGTVVLHVSPEAAENGTFSLIETGDMIELDVNNRLLNLHVSEAELAERRKRQTPFKSPYTRGYTRLFVEHVEQACQGADFDFLKGGSGSEVTRDSH